MTRAEQKLRVLELVDRGEKIGKKEYSTSGLIPTISGPLFEAWMNEINIFNDRYLKDHPLYSDIHATCFHHKTQITSHKFMMGHLEALANDSEYWQESQPESTTSLPVTNSKGENVTMTPIIFISHRTEDAGVADLLRDYLIATGIPNEYVFCSSLPGNDVKSVISREVKEKIANSAVNIAILSRGYYESAYCINEAGIIWLQDPQTPAIVVGLPEISHTNMYGFLNGDYKLRRLDNANDISEIYDTVRDSVGTAPVSFSVATAASQKLSVRYTEYLKSRVLPAAVPTQTTTSSALIEEVTTDDERVVLYYILTKKVRRVRKYDINTWMSENEIYNINVDNALDLLASLGAGTYEYETLNMDVGVFRKYTANADEIILSLTPVVEKYRIPCRARFVELWDAGTFTDEDKLFVAYIIQNRVTTLGAAWREKDQIASIHQWELNNLLDGSVASTYSAHLNQFVENRFVYESDWTDHGNAREYTLCPSLKNLLLGVDFPYASDLQAVLESHTEKLPF